MMLVVTFLIPWSHKPKLNFAAEDTKAWWDTLNGTHLMKVAFSTATTAALIALSNCYLTSCCYDYQNQLLPCNWVGLQAPIVSKHILMPWDHGVVGHSPKLTGFNCSGLPIAMRYHFTVLRIWGHLYLCRDGWALQDDLAGSLLIGEHTISAYLLLWQTSQAF